MEDVALHDLDERLKSAWEEYGEETWGKNRRGQPTIGETYTKVINDAKNRIKRGDPMVSVHNMLMDDIQSEEQDAYEWVYLIGRVTSCRVIYALVAVRKLWELLRNRGLL